MFHRIYIHETHTHRLASQLSSPPVSGDDRASGSASDAEDNESTWQDRRRQDGLVAPNCGSQIVWLNGSADGRLNKKVCRLPASKLATLLASDERFPGGARVETTESDWGIAFLCTFHMIPYMASRDSKRRQAPDCFREGGSRTLNGKTTKRRHRHIAEAFFSLNNTSLPHLGAKKCMSRRRHP